MRGFAKESTADYLTKQKRFSGRIDALKLGSTTVADYDYIGSRMARRKSGSSLYFEPVYDNLGRIVEHRTYSLAGVTKFMYEYAANTNNIDKKYFAHRGQNIYNDYDYDAIGRLVDVVYHDSDTESFPMDDLGNRSGDVTQRDGVHSYDPNELTNQYITIDANSIEYDAAGNLAVDKDDYIYTYDYENRVVKIEKPDGQGGTSDVAEYDYDALGRRIRKVDCITSSNSRLYYYSDNWQVLCEYNGSGTLKAWYMYGNYIDEVLSRNTSSTLFIAWFTQKYYVHDHLYSVAALTNYSGLTTLERYEYDAYGNVHVLDSDFSADADGLSDYGNPILFHRPKAGYA